LKRKGGCLFRLEAAVLMKRQKKGQKRNRAKQKKMGAVLQLISFRNLFANIEKALTGKWISKFFSAKI